jgi:hypothetical protein
VEVSVKRVKHQHQLQQLQHLAQQRQQQHDSEQAEETANDNNDQSNANNNNSHNEAESTKPQIPALVVHSESHRTLTRHGSNDNLSGKQSSKEVCKRLAPHRLFLMFIVSFLFRYL